MGKLTAVSVRNAKPDPVKVRRLLDGDGLMLVVKPNGAKSWLLRIAAGGRRRDFGLGSVAHVGLAEARDAAAELRRQVRAGLDPVAEKRKARAAAPPTFAELAKQVHAEEKAAWRNGKHAEQWLSSLQLHIFPKLGRLQVDQIDGPMVREALMPIWQSRPETARRLLQRTVLVLDRAAALRHRETQIPSRARALGLPAQANKKGHFAAMPYPELPAFVASLRKADETTGRLALEFTILTAARSGETRGARWEEFDLAERTWTVPGDRMKAGKPHTVPLSDRALAIVERMNEARRCELVFPGHRDKPLSDMTMAKVLRDAKLPFTVHGFRSAFRDWAAERTSFPREVAEAALAHTNPNKVEAAYRRTNYLDRRRELMRAWADFLDGRSADVVPIRGAA